MAQSIDAGAFRWSRLGQLLCLLASGLIVGAVVHRFVPFLMKLSEYGYPAEEFARTHRISSVFLPIGYSSFVGLCIWILHSDVGLFAANLVLYLIWILLIWLMMGRLGATQKQAFYTALAFVFYPDTVMALNTVAHTTTTSASLCLLAFVVCVVSLICRPNSYKNDAWFAMTMAWAILVRPNLLPLLPLAWFLYWKFKLPNGLLRSAAQVAAAASIYVIVTIAVHGSLFWPQNGPYNFFLGANPYTERALIDTQNAETSMYPALKDLGYTADMDWKRADNLPGNHDTRNLGFRRIYMHGAFVFIKTHPLAMVKLTGLKLVTLLRPDLVHYSVKSVQGMAKILFAFTVPLWLVALFVLPRPGSGVLRIIVPLTVVAYVVPFLLTITAPHFRTPIDILCTVEILAMIFAWRRKKEAQRSSTPTVPVEQVC